MAETSIYDVLLRPVVTEKSTVMSETLNQYVFEVFVQNLEDKAIRTSAATFGPTRYSPVFLSNLQAPRTFGARIKANF